MNLPGVPFLTPTTGCWLGGRAAGDRDRGGQRRQSDDREGDDGVADQQRSARQPRRLGLVEVVVFIQVVVFVAVVVELGLVRHRIRQLRFLGVHAGEPRRRQRRRRTAGEPGGGRHRG